MKSGEMPPIQNYSKTKQYISLTTGYLTAFFFGFHLTGIEMIRNHFFEKDAALRSTFYIIAAIPFAVPILSGLLRPFIHLTISLQKFQQKALKQTKQKKSKSAEFLMGEPCLMSYCS